jgi:hypothetical protein
MTREELIAQALAFPGAVDDYSFGEDLLIVKVGGKVFAWIPSAMVARPPFPTARWSPACPGDIAPRSVASMCRHPRRVPLRGVRSTHSCGGKV